MTWKLTHKSQIHVRHILHTTGVNDVWMLQGVGDTTGVLNVLNKE